MSGGIYLIQDNGQLVEMTEQTYDSEDLLQGLLAKYPNLLAGDQIDSAAPRRWLLIAREMGLPSEEEGADRWAVDHLFLDQDAIPTLVEVKRSTDTRLRREVVGQMLEYAANAVVYWPVEKIRTQFESSCEGQKCDPEQKLKESLGIAEQEPFWKKVETNLQTGKIRLIFVADKIPPELRRIVEFLNAQMNSAEVLAVEIKQYVGQDLKTLIPRVIGQTAEAQQRKAAAYRKGKQWDETSFFLVLEKNRGDEEITAANKILGWSTTNGLRIRWGTGEQFGTFRPTLDYAGTTRSLITVWTDGNIQIDVVAIPPFTDETKHLDLLKRLNVNILPGRVYAWTELSALRDEAALKHFLEGLTWAVQEIKAS